MKAIISQEGDLSHLCCFFIFLPQENLKRLRESITRRHKERQKAGKELGKIVQMFWSSGSMCMDMVGGVVAAGLVGRMMAVIWAAQPAKDSPLSVIENTQVVFAYVATFLLLDLRE